MSESILKHFMTHYVVAMCGDLNRGERMNCAVLAWDMNEGEHAPVTIHMTKNWDRIIRAFWSHLPPNGIHGLAENITERLAAIKTLKDFHWAVERMGPYTPFEFTEERGSIASPEQTAGDMADWFLHRAGPPC
jgi:hypothetical protein